MSYTSNPSVFTAKAIVLSASIFVAAHSTVGWALEFPETALRPPIEENPQADLFGQAFAIDGDTMVVGYPESDYDGSKSGAVVVFRRDNNEWLHLATLRAEDGGLGHLLGSSVGISGSTIVAGAPGHRHAGYRSGAVYVFEDHSGLQDWSDVTETRFTSPDAMTNDRFGRSVATDGRAIAVGAPRVSTNHRTITVFVDTSGVGDWTTAERYAVPASNLSTGVRVGNAVDIRGRMVVGTAADGGSSQQLVRMGIDTSVAGDWSSIQEVRLQSGFQIIGSFSSEGDIEIVDDRTIAAGIPYLSTFGYITEDGHVWMIRDTSVAGDWSSIAWKSIRPQPWSSSTARFFGASLAASDGFLLVGAPERSCSDGSSCGAINVFRDTSLDGDWSTFEDLEYFADEQGAWDYFGSWVGLYQNDFVVSTPTDDGLSAGAGLIQTLDGSDPTLVIDELFPVGFADTSGVKFGQQMATDGRTLLATSYGAQGTELHIWTRDDSGWLPRQRFSYGSTAASLAIEGHHAFLGQPWHPDGDRLLHLWDTSDSGDWSSFETELIDLEFGSGNDDLGFALLLRGRELFVGARYADLQASNGGAVVLMTDNSMDGDWSSFDSATLIATDLERYDEFGSSLALSGRTLAVGAPNSFSSSTENGAVHLFQRDPDPESSWSQVARIEATQLDFGSLLGFAVSLADEHSLVAGAPRADSGAVEDAGAAFVFRDLSTDGDWSLFDELLREPASPIPSGFFGASVALSGATLAIGSPNDNYEPDPVPGEVLVLWDDSVDGDWSVTSTANLVASDAAAGDEFGTEIRVDSAYLWVTAPLAQYEGSENGTVYLYQMPVMTSDLGVSPTEISPTRNSSTLVDTVWRVFNEGTDVARGVRLTIRSDASLRILNATTPQGNCWLSNEETQCTLGRIEANDSVSVAISVQRIGGGPEEMIGTVGSDSDDPVPENNAGGLELAHPLFIDGFETGSTDRWSSMVP